MQIQETGDLAIILNAALSQRAKIGHYLNPFEIARAIQLCRCIFFNNFHQLNYSLPSISCPDLKLLAVTGFEISSFLRPNLQRAITIKNDFFYF